MSDDEARRDLMAILDDAKTFEELVAGVRAAQGGKVRHADFDEALRFITTRDPNGLDEPLQERFAQVLSRMVESKEALALAAVLESSGD